MTNIMMPQPLFRETNPILNGGMCLQGEVVCFWAQDIDVLKAEIDALTWERDEGEWKRGYLETINWMGDQRATLETENARLAAELATHQQAVGHFLSELYAVMVDPLADGQVTVQIMQADLMAAALKNREVENQLAADVAKLREALVADPRCQVIDGGYCWCAGYYLPNHASECERKRRILAETAPKEEAPG